MPADDYPQLLNICEVQMKFQHCFNCGPRAALWLVPPRDATNRGPSACGPRRGWGAGRRGTESPRFPAPLSTFFRVPQGHHWSGRSH